MWFTPWSWVRSSQVATLAPDDMIAAYGTQDFVPFGRDYVLQHPGGVSGEVRNNLTSVDHGLPLVKSFTDISLTGKASEKVRLSAQSIKLN